MLHSNNYTATPLFVLQSTSDSDRPPRAFRGIFAAEVEAFPFHLCNQKAFQALPRHVRTKGELQNRISRFSKYRSRMRTAGEGGLTLVSASRAAVPHPASVRNLPNRRTELMPSRLFPSARHNCSREATAGMDSGITNPAERKSKTSSQPKPKKQRQANQRKPNKHQRQAAKQTSKPAPACQENQANQANQSCTNAKKPAARQGRTAGKSLKAGKDYQPRIFLKS